MEVFLPANKLVRNFKKIQQFQFILKTQNKANVLPFPSTRLPKLSLFRLLTSISSMSHHVVSTIQFLRLTISFIFGFVFSSLKTLK